MSSTGAHVFEYDVEKEILQNTSLGFRVMVFDADFVRGLTSSLTKVYQSGAIVILYQMGLAYGELLGKRIIETGGLGRQTEAAYRQCYASLAIGKFQFPPLGALLAAGPPEQMMVSLNDSFIAMALGRTGKPECHIVRGLLEGTAKVVLSKDYQCQETKCLSKGDNICEFVIRLRKS